MSSHEVAIIEEPVRAHVVKRDTVDGWTGNLAQVVHLAENIAQTDFVPKALRGKPAAVTACILFGRELGFGPLQSLQAIHVVDGRPGVSAEMARAMAMSAGHEIVIDESTTARCVARGRRAGSQEWTTITWTMDDAKRAGIDGKDNWRKHPRRMLQARATAELVHLLFPDAAGAMPMTIEEMAEDGGDIAGQVGDEAPARAGRTARRSRRSAPAATDDAGPPPPPLPGDEPSAPARAATDAPPLPPADAPPAEESGDEASRSQLTKILVTFKEIGIDNRADRMTATAAIVGRPLESSKALTKEDASAVIETLERVKSADDPLAALDAIVASTAQGDDQASLPIDGAAAHSSAPGDA